VAVTETPEVSGCLVAVVLGLAALIVTVVVAAMVWMVLVLVVAFG
jgi:hypothetical protein